MSPMPVHLRLGFVLLCLLASRAGAARVKAKEQENVKAEEQGSVQAAAEDWETQFDAKLHKIDLSFMREVMTEVVVPKAQLDKNKLVRYPLCEKMGTDSARCRTNCIPSSVCPNPTLRLGTLSNEMLVEALVALADDAAFWQMAIEGIKKEAVGIAKDWHKDEKKDEFDQHKDKEFPIGKFLMAEPAFRDGDEHALYSVLGSLQFSVQFGLTLNGKLKKYGDGKERELDEDLKKPCGACGECPAKCAVLAVEYLFTSRPPLGAPNAQYPLGEWEPYDMKNPKNFGAKVELHDAIVRKLA